MNRMPVDYLRDILNAMQKIQEFVWKTATERIPQVVPSLRKVLNEFDRP